MNVRTWQGTFAYLDSWEERYSYLIDQGRKLAPFHHKTAAHRVPGCISQVWLDVQKDPTTSKPVIWLDSDSFIVKGLLCLLKDVYEYKMEISPPQPMLTMKMVFQSLDLEHFLTPNRVQGLFFVEKTLSSALEELKFL